MAISRNTLFVLGLCLPMTATQAAEPAPTTAGTIELNAPPAVLNANDRAAMSQDDAGLVVQTLPDGSKMVDLQGRFQLAATAAVDADGDLHKNCLTGADIHRHGIEAATVSNARDEQ